MTRRWVATVLAIVVGMAGAPAGRAETLVHQGELTGLDGQAVADGGYRMLFSLWTEAQGGELLWHEEHPAVAVGHGHFSVILGSRAPIEAGLAEAWLETTVDGDRLEPRAKVDPAREDCTVDGMLSADRLRLTHEGYTGYAEVDWHAGGMYLTNYAENSTMYFWTRFDNVISPKMWIRGSGEVNIGAQGYTSQGLLQVAEGRVSVVGATDASLAAGSGYLVLGDEAGANLLLDSNEIMARDNGATSGLYLQQNGGDVYVNGAVVHSSDARLKKDVADLERGLDEVMRLRPVSFAWANRDDGRRVGLVAQEVRAVVDEVVYEGQDGTLGVAYESLVPVLVKAVQQQQAEIERLKQELEALRCQRASP